MRVKRIWFVLSFFLTVLAACNNVPKNNLPSKLEHLAMDTTTANIYIDSFIQRKDFKGCAKFLDTLIYFNPNYGKYFSNRAFCCAQLGIPYKAQLDWERCLTLEFEVSDCYYNLGLNSICWSKDSLGKAYLLKCLAIDSQHIDARKLLEHLAHEPDLFKNKAKP